MKWNAGKFQALVAEEIRFHALFLPMLTSLYDTYEAMGTCLVE